MSATPKLFDWPTAEDWHAEPDADEITEQAIAIEYMRDTIRRQAARIAELTK